MVESFSNTPENNENEKENPMPNGNNGNNAPHNGTHAVLTLMNKDGTSYYVFTHYNGEPVNMASALARAFLKTWQLPRFEADDYGAAFIAMNKDAQGGIRLSNGPQHYQDLAYTYEIGPSTKQKENAQICILAKDGEGEVIFNGRVKDFIGQFGDKNAKKVWNQIDPSDNKLALDDRAAKKAAALAKLSPEERSLLGV